MSKYKKPKVGFLDHVAGKQDKNNPVDDVLKESAESAPQPEPKKTKTQTKKPVIREEVQPSSPGMESYVKATQVDPNSAKGSFNENVVEGYTTPEVKETKLESDPNKMSAYQRALQESKTKKKEAVQHLGEAADFLGGEPEKPVTQADLKALKVSLASLGGGGVGPDEVYRIIDKYGYSLRDSDRQDIIDGIESVVLGTTDSLPEGSINLYYTEARDDSNFSHNLSQINTDDIAEGSNNLYYTDSRARSAIQSIDSALIYDPVTGNLAFNENFEGRYTTENFDSDFALKNTDSLAEGSTNLYYTDARARSAISSGDSYIQYDSTTGVLTFDESVIPEGYTTADHDSDTLVQVDSDYVIERSQKHYDVRYVNMTGDSMSGDLIMKQGTKIRVDEIHNGGGWGAGSILFKTGGGSPQMEVGIGGQGIQVYTLPIFYNHNASSNIGRNGVYDLIDVRYFDSNTSILSANLQSQIDSLDARVDSDDIEIANLKNKVDALDLNNAIALEYDKILSFDSNTDSVPRGEYGVHFSGGTEYIDVDKFYFNCFDRNDVFVPYNETDSNDVIVLTDSDGGLARYEVVGTTDFGNHFRVDVTPVVAKGAPADFISMKLFPGLDNVSLAPYTYVDAQDKILQDQIDSLGNTYVNISGDTMTGALNMDAQINMNAGGGRNKVINLASPTDKYHAANKIYVDEADSDLQVQIDALDSAIDSDHAWAAGKFNSLDAQYVNVDGDTMTGALVIDSADLNVNYGNITVKGTDKYIRAVDGAKLQSNIIRSVGNSNISISRNGERRFLIGTNSLVADKKIKYNTGYNRDSYTSDLAGTDSYTLMPKWYVDSAIAASAFEFDSSQFVDVEGDSMTGALTISRPEGSIAFKINRDDQERVRFRSNGLINWTGNATDARLNKDGGNFTISVNNDTYMKFDLAQAEIEVNKTLTLAAPDPVINLPNNSDVGELQSNSNRRLYWGQNSVGIDVPLVLNAETALRIKPDDGETRYIEFFKNKSNTDVSNIDISLIGNTSYNRLRIMGGSGQAERMVEFRSGGAIEFGRDFTMTNHKITALADPTNAQEAANKRYVDSELSNYLPLAGGTVTGQVNFDGEQYLNNDTYLKQATSWKLRSRNADGNLRTLLALDADGETFHVYNLDEPGGPSHAATKNYVDTQLALVGGGNVPVGMIGMHFGATAPIGYFILNGAAFDIATYPLLHQYLLDNVYGYVAGTLPDYRGYFPGGYGAQGMTDMGRKYGWQTGLPTNAKTASGGSHSHGSSASTSSSSKVGSTSGGGHSHNITSLYKNKDNKSENSGQTTNINDTNYKSGVSTTISTNSTPSHTHSTDLGQASFSTSVTVQSGGSHSHTLSNFDTRTAPNAFAVNFIIRHD